MVTLEKEVAVPGDFKAQESGDPLVREFSARVAAVEGPMFVRSLRRLSRRLDVERVANARCTKWISP